MIERLYMACEKDSETGSAQFGPFKTSGEAEKQARKLGWPWVLVYTNTVDDRGLVVDVRKRMYRIDGKNSAQIVYAGPMDIDDIRGRFCPPVPPMSADEEKFFGQYEKQMEEHLAKG
jgi:hypothetical protein